MTLQRRLGRGHIYVVVTSILAHMTSPWYLGGMSDVQKPDPERLVRYPLTWPASMAERVAAEAKAHTMPMAVWLREAVREKLERTEKGGIDG